MVAVVTGASSGIGNAIAKTLLQNGYTVYGISRKSIDDGFVSLQGDVTDTKRMKEIFDQVVAKEGGIDVFVNNAGFGIGGELVDGDIDTVKKLFDVNLTAYATNMVMAGKIMKGQGHGKIINICSLSALFPLPLQSCYSASKAGIDVLSRTARTELKPHGVWVSEVLPGDVATGFTDARVVDKSDNNKVNKSVEKMAGYERKGMSPYVVAKKVAKLAKAKRPKARVSVGSLKLLIGIAKVLPTRFLDWLIAKLYC